jgi:hypothetical protein
MNNAIFDYGRASPDRNRWNRLILRAIAGTTAVVVLWAGVLLYRLHLEEARFRALTSPANIRGKTVFQIVSLLGRPQEDHLDEKPPTTSAVWTPPPINYSPTNHSHSNGHLGYGDPYGTVYCYIEIRNGAATQVKLLPDMR